MRFWRVPLLNIVGLIMLLLICTACSGGQTSHSAASTPTNTAVTPSPAGTPTPATIYQSSLQSPLSGWPSNQNTFPASDGYHIVGGYLVFAPISNQTDVSISVDVTQISGDTQADYGITFRHTTDNRYEFDINSSGQWYVLKDVNTNHTNLINLTQNNALHMGLHVSNTLKVECKGSHFMFFVNGVLVGQTDDAAHPTGQVGLDGDNNAEVVFSNFQVSALD